MLLKKGVHNGFTPFQIGNIMCRETITKESKIEKIIREAKEKSAFMEKSESAFMECVSTVMDRVLNEM